MGKKGTKRKTKWRALPLVEEAGGSGNEEELHDEDRSTTSSVVGPTTNAYKPQTPFYKASEKPYRQNRRFSYDRYKNKEPLVKLESKTFDEEEYTKITTPRQDVLFKKGYFGRKRESSIEETTHHSGEVEGEETMVDQIIITNGFVDERGHYLVNGNSYEIYDPYSNTVTVVVGPPPYTNGVTQPVLAAVSCQPVPLQPVDWYPPGSDWPSQGSAWTPSYPRSPQAEPISHNSENTPNFHVPESQIPNLYHQPAYVVPGYVYGESPVYNVAGEVVDTTRHNPPTESLGSNENKSKVDEQTITDSNEKVEDIAANSNPTEEEKPSANFSEQTTATNLPAEEISSETIVSETKDTNEVKEVSLNQIQDTEMQEFRPREEKRVEKQSHSTQTNSVEKGEKIVYPRSEIPFKESHSTQTSPEQTFSSNKLDTRIQQENEKNESNKSVPDLLLSSMAKSEQPPKQNWKAQQNKYKEYCNSSPKKYQEESPRKIYQKRTNFSEERKLKVESTEKADRKIESSPLKISYAMKAMAGLENIDKNPKVVNEVSSALNNKIPNGLKNAQTNLVNGTCQVLTTNGVNRTNYPKHVSSDRYNSYEEKKNFNGNVKNGFAKTRYNKSSYGNKTANDRNNLKDLKIKDRKIQLKSFETPSEKSPEIKEKCEEVANESTSQSEKSSTVSELSSPTELSSGQNTPPEKLIVRKMEQKIANEINKSFEEKLKQNLTKNEETLTKEEKQIEEPLEKSPDGNKGKKNQESKKKNKGKTGTAETTKETLKPNKKKKKKVAEESKAKEEASDGREEIEFLPNFIIQEPKDLIFGSWSGMKDEQVEMISKMDTVPGGEEEILKTLGIKEDQIGFSKLPLHSDLLMMLPVFGWSRPKFKIEDIFAPTKQLHNDLFTRRNITSMKSTKPEEFFASVVDNPVLEKSEKKKDPNKNGKKDQAKGGSETSSEKNHASKNQCSGSSSSGQKKNGNVTKAINKTSKNSAKSKAIKEEPNEKKMETNTETDTRTENEVKENKFGIVDAVNTWLKEQGDTGKVLSVDSLPVQTLETLTKLENEEIKECKVEENYDKSDQKNVTSNPMHALYGSEEEERVTIADFRGVNECIRVANVINDGFIHIDEELYPRKKNLKKNRMQRSSSLDGKFSEPSIKKHLKFLTDSALFCQDLISDVRNGLPTKNEYATEELCDPKQSVLKYYILSPSQQTAKVKSVQESDSENEAFDALEYKFLTKENVAVKEESDEKCVDRNGNVSVTDSGVHSDMDSSEDMANDPHKDVSCKLQ